MHISSFCFKNAQIPEFFYKSPHNRYLKGFVKKNFKKNRKKKSCTYTKKVANMQKLKNIYSFFGIFFSELHSLGTFWRVPKSKMSCGEMNVNATCGRKVTLFMSPFPFHFHRCFWLPPSFTFLLTNTSLGLGIRASEAPTTRRTLTSVTRTLSVRPRPSLDSCSHSPVTNFRLHLVLPVICYLASEYQKIDFINIDENELRIVCLTVKFSFYYTSYDEPTQFSSCSLPVKAAKSRITFIRNVLEGPEVGFLKRITKQMLSTSACPLTLFMSPFPFHFHRCFWLPPSFTFLLTNTSLGLGIRASEAPTTRRTLTPSLALSQSDHVHLSTPVPILQLRILDFILFCQRLAILPLAMVHTSGNLFTNMSLGKLVSFTNTIKAMEPFFSVVVLSDMFLGETEPRFLWNNYMLEIMIDNKIEGEIPKLKFGEIGVLKRVVESIGTKLQPLEPKLESAGFWKEEAV
ncbi:hypothetical protein LXL04_015401 [Taraxacum kok-saghyz]